MKRYPAFNGQFKDLFLSLEVGAFVDDMEGLKKRLETTKPFPVTPWSDIKKIKVFNSPRSYPEALEEDYKDKFPDGYSFSGWFKWSQPV